MQTLWAIKTEEGFFHPIPETTVEALRVRPEVVAPSVLVYRQFLDSGVQTHWRPFTFAIAGGAGLT